VGLLAETNDMDLLQRTQCGRDINRHYYRRIDIDDALTRPVVQALFELVRFRNTHPAFSGEFHLLPSAEHEIHIQWRSDTDWAHLQVDLRATRGTISYSSQGNHRSMVLACGAIKEVAR
jgi:sucrose phosphorylase